MGPRFLLMTRLLLVNLLLLVVIGLIFSLMVSDLAKTINVPTSIGTMLLVAMLKVF